MCTWYSLGLHILRSQTSRVDVIWLSHLGINGPFLVPQIRTTRLQPEPSLSAYSEKMTVP